MIVTADDFGASREVNEAVEAANREGILTTASLMVAAPAAADAVIRARRLRGLRVGLHLVLVEGKAVLPPANIPHLVDPAGTFPNRQVRAGFHFFFSPAARREVAREIEAQFEAFQATGLPLDHVNAHKHMHLHPTVAQLIIEIGRKFGLRAVRLPYEPQAIIAAAEIKPAIGLGAKTLALWSRRLYRQLLQAELRMNDRLFGLAWTGAVTEERLLRLLPLLPDGVNEIYVHPAIETPASLSRIPGYQPGAEFAMLLSPKVRARLGDLGIALTNFSALD